MGQNRSKMIEECMKNAMSRINFSQPTQLGMSPNPCHVAQLDPFIQQNTRARLSFTFELL